jgi:hypothetical protein
MKVKDVVMKEAVLGNYIPGKSAEIKDPEHGTTTTLDLTKPENMTKLKPNEQGQLEFDPTPEAGEKGASEAPPIKPGTPVTVSPTEAMGDEDDGYDPNDTPQQIMDKAFAEKPELKQYVVVDAEGDIDMSETFAKMAEEFSNMLPQLVGFFEKIVTMTEQWMASPEFATECDEPEKLVQDLQEAKAVLADMKAKMPQLQQDIKQAAADLRSVPKDQAKKQFGAIKGPDTARLQELAGLSETRSDYTQDEMVAMLTGQKSQQQVDADAEKTRGPDKGKAQSPMPSRNETDPSKRAANATYKPGTANSAMPSRSVKETAELEAMLRIAGLR